MITTKHSAIQLRYTDKNQQLVIDDETAGKLVTTVAAAIDACKASGKEDEFWRQFTEMRELLTNWLVDHQELIADAYITVRDSAILFLALQQSPSFNQELEDSLTELDLAIAHNPDLDLIRLNVLAIPKTSQASVESLLVCGGANL
ncbi:MAG: hypothetical protein K2X38_00490 [Gemmataceae bacterium]|nr:hypothetical protein [Gemmataceae bacterium]